MTIDFTQVKNLTIPEGEVTKITDANGNVLWQKITQGWHTIWEGSKTCSTKKNGYDIVFSSAEENFAQTAAGTGYEPKIRITFSYSSNNTGDYGWRNKFIINDEWYSNPQSSPITIEAVRDSKNSIYICAQCCEDSDSGYSVVYAGLQKERDTENNRIIFHLRGSASSNTTSYPGYFTITFTVTKIEQYY